MGKIMAVDGNSILNRAFYALQGPKLLSTSAGLHTNAIFGFLNIINKYIEEEDPQYICAAFDLKAPTFRHAQFDSYKAKRKGMPEELAEQLPIMKEILGAMNIACIEKEGYEADDIIGTISLMAEQSGMETVIITGDRDSFQLASERTRIKLPVTKGGRTETEEYDADAVFEKYGVTPAQFVDVKGLMGDQSDNIPGVPGIGEKTAIKLISEFGSIENVYDNISKIDKEGLRQKLAENRELAFLSKCLSQIDRSVPLEVGIEDLKRKEVNRPRLYELFKKLEFKKLIEKMGLEVEYEQPGATAEKGEKTADKTRFVEIRDVESINKLKNIISRKGSFSILCLFDRADEFRSRLSGVAISAEEGTVYYIELSEGLLYDPQGSISEDVFVKEMGLIFSNPGIKKIGHDMKPIITYLKWKGVQFNGLAFDTMIAAYIINSSRNDYSLASLALEYLNENFEDMEQLKGKGKKRLSFREINRDLLRDSLVKHCSTLDSLCKLFDDIIAECRQEFLYYEIELPLVSVLADMEYHGFKVNTDELRNFSAKLDDRINEITGEIYEEAGEEFNINSPRQLGAILFDKLGLPAVKKTKTGYSTDAEVLEKLAPMHEIVEKILEYRQLVKLKTTYAEGLLNVVNPLTGRIHSSFNQTVTATGRISSTEPNLQNIPVKLDLGREIRRAFIPENSSYLLTDADYSQIELRLLAHISDDENLKNAFIKGEDIHTSTASAVFNVDVREVTLSMRSRAKAVNFGIIYGIGDFSLSRDLGITRQEAREYIDGYLDKYPGVRNYMHAIVESGKEKGYVSTIFNRRRYLPELKSSNFNIRSFGERVALNMPIQGTAADIIKIAMVKVYNELVSHNMKSRLILQVHDELIIETHKDEKEKVEEILKESMEKAVSLKVPLVAEVKSGNSWFDTK